MKYLVKNLPTKKQIKDFYNLNDLKSFKVKSIDISKPYIILKCKIKEDKNFFIPSFYQNLQSMDKKGNFVMYIKNEYFEHLTKNIELNLDYIKALSCKEERNKLNY